MKNTTLSLLFAPFFCTCIFAQQEEEIQIGYKPNHKYHQVLNQTTHTELRYSGSKHALESLVSQNIKNPTIEDKVQNSEAVITTGSMINDSIFSLKIEMTKNKSENGKKSIPDGTTIYGTSALMGMPVLDSVVSEGMEPKMKKLFLSGIQNILSQISFPKQKLKIGQKFIHDIPLSVPVGANSIDMTIVTTYKLKSIADGIAYFDISQVYKMNNQTSQATTVATGSGTGKMAYDMKENFYRQYDLNSSIMMKMILEQLIFTIKTNSGFHQNYTITSG